MVAVPQKKEDFNLKKFELIGLTPIIARFIVCICLFTLLKNYMFRIWGWVSLKKDSIRLNFFSLVFCMQDLNEKTLEPCINIAKGKSWTSFEWLGLTAVCAGLTYGAYKLFSFAVNQTSCTQTISSKGDRLSAAKSSIPKTPGELVNDEFPGQVIKELNVIINNVMNQNSNAIYCYDHLTRLSASRSNWIKNQNISSVKVYHKEALEFQGLMEISVKHIVNIQDKIIGLRNFIDSSLKKDTLNLGNHELARHIRPNLNGVEVSIIRPFDVDSQVKGDLLVSLDKKTSLKDCLENQVDYYLNLKNALRILIDNQNSSREEALAAQLSEVIKNQADSSSKLKELQNLDIDLNNLNITFALNTDELDLMDKNLDSVSNLSDVCIKTNEAVLILSSFL